jgi:hypothetical protein
VRARLGALSDVQCMQLFLREIEQSHRDFFAIASQRPLALGGAEFARLRWTGEKGGKTLTGMLSCGELAGHYYVVHLVDELRSATRSFPGVQASLRQLEIRAP